MTRSRSFLSFRALAAFALAALFPMISLAEPHAAPACRVVPSGGLPVVYAGAKWVAKKWDLAEAKALVDRLVANGVCAVDPAQLPECSIEPNGIFYAVYSEGFWKNFHESDLAGAQALVDELRGYQFCR